MYLSRLQLFGFKSFANKIKLDFNEGVSCIIGPNGSGKSNIVDAVRWVLGEQRTTALRSDKMQSVIFNGTRNRKPMGMAEVSMTIQNNKKILNTEFDEVVITRRLYRSGESEYLINNVPVRLKDVLNLFMDTGLGPNSYSVIELKMVESILSENKNERRQLFEEAAGIVKYKIRRKSALAKLDATRNDLVRINDIISEVEKKVNSLSRQVGKARRYLQYSEELRKTDIDLCRFRYHALLDEIRPLQVQLQEISKIKEESHHQITIEEALLEEYKREQIQREQQLQKLSLQINELDQQIARINQDLAVAETKSEQLKQNKERFLTEIDAAEHKIKLLQENLQSYQNELDELSLKKEEAEKRLSEIESQRQAELEVLQAEKQEIDKLNTAFKKQFQEVARLKDQLAQKEYQQQFLKEQAEELEQKLAEYQRSVQRLETKLAGNKKQQAELIRKQDDVKTVLLNLKTKLQQLQSERSDIIQQKNGLLGKLEQARSRYNFFKQIMSSYEGFRKSTQYVMTHKEALPGIHGTLSEIITVNEPYSKLLESLLGDALNYVIVDDVTSARRIIEFVKKEKKGRITLIPMDRVPSVANDTKKSANNLTFLKAEIQVEDSYRNLIDLLLGDVIIVPTLDEAIALSEKYPQFRFVSEQGEMVNFNREISSGETSDRTVSLVGRKEQLKKIEQEIKSVESQVARLDQRIESNEQAILQTRQSIEKQSNALNDLQNQRIDLEKQENQLQYEISTLQNEIRQTDQHLTQIRSDRQRLSKETETLQVQLDGMQKELNELEAETIQRTGAYEQKSESMEYLLEEVQKARLQANNLRNQFQNRQADIQRTRRTIDDLNNEMERKRQEIKKINETLVEIDIQNEKHEQERVQIWQSRDKLESQKQEMLQAFQELRDKINDLEEKTKEYRRKHDSTLEKSRQLELKINESHYKAESIREYALKEYSEDVETAIPYQDFDEHAAEERIEMLRLRIKNMGPVNPLAVQEYDEEKKRLDFLTQQRDDLLNAEKSLIDTIDKINQTAREQFLTTFKQIKENFEEVFRSFFENGEGTIELDAEADPLEADIHIKVRTKGKRLQTLSLLSSGEKTLTAISLLFSIYLVKPSPFCILDEVDAPLDDMNIGRFTEALKSFSQNTQFIVVTHNKRTMEAASTLYGVTMEEEGVSKIVSVKFN